MKKRRHFTFIVEFRGGIYCSQVQSETVNKSVHAWLKQIAAEGGIKHLGEKARKEIEIMAKDQDHKPAPLTGLKNIWCIGFSTRQGFLIAEIVQTDMS